MKRRSLRVGFLGALILAVTACSSTQLPSERISQNPAGFYSLPAKYQPVVLSGNITEGMSPQAVYYAWGSPSIVSEGKDGRKTLLRWVYQTQQAVLSPAPRFYTGMGWGGYGCRSWMGNSFGVGNDLMYVPVNTAHVLFENDKVKSWEKNL